jgi:hypothetical protein
MIVTEQYMTRKDGVVLMRTYSDRKKTILQVETGNKYSEAIDVSPVRYTYTETEEDVPDDSEHDES